MRTTVCGMFGLEVPIFAFSHCRDVVVAASRAGGKPYAAAGPMPGCGPTRPRRAPDAPPTLQMPLQSVMVAEALTRVRKAGNYELTSYPAGQVIGQIRGETSVRQVFADMLTEYAETLERLETLSQ